MKLWLGISGLVFVALVVVAVFLVPNSPDTNATAAKVIAYYDNYKTKLQITSYLTEVAIFVGLFFSGICVISSPQRPGRPSRPSDSRARWSSPFAVRRMVAAASLAVAASSVSLMLLRSGGDSRNWVSSASSFETRARRWCCRPGETVSEPLASDSPRAGRPPSSRRRALRPQEGPYLARPSWDLPSRREPRVTRTRPKPRSTVRPR
jgi:hypothetical protein